MCTVASHRIGNGLYALISYLNLPWKRFLLCPVHAHAHQKRREKEGARQILRRGADAYEMRPGKRSVMMMERTRERVVLPPAGSGWCSFPGAHVSSFGVVMVADPHTTTCSYPHTHTHTCILRKRDLHTASHIGVSDRGRRTNRPLHRRVSLATLRTEGHHRRRR